MEKIVKFKNEKKLNKKKLCILIALIILIVLIITISIIYNLNKEFRKFMDKYIFRKDITEENVSVIEIDYDSNINIIPYGKNICILAENTLYQYNSSGKQEKEVKVEINNPVYDTNGKYLIIGEKDNQRLYLIAEDHIIWEKNVDGNLNKVSVNKNGYVSAIVTGTTHKSVIITYDAKGNELFKSYLSKSIAVDSSISPDNTELAYAEVNSSGTTVQSNVKVISISDIKEKNIEPKYTYAASADRLILRIKYQDKNQLICMCDDSIYKLDNGYETELLKLVENDNNITFADIELNNYAFRTLEKSTGLFSANTIIQMKNISSEKENTYTIEDVVKSVICCDNVIAVNLGDEVDFIDTNGWLIKRYTSSQVIENIVVANGLAGIIYRDKIELINL